MPRGFVRLASIWSTHACRPRNGAMNRVTTTVIPSTSVISTIFSCAYCGRSFSRSSKRWFSMTGSRSR
jgi:hypothetical protein